MIGDPVRIPSRDCSVCGKPITACASIGCNVEPQAGDLSMCAYCGNVVEFVTSTTIRELTPYEKQEIDKLPSIKFARQMLKGLKH